MIITHVLVKCLIVSVWCGTDTQNGCWSVISCYNYLLKAQNSFKHCSGEHNQLWRDLFAAENHDGSVMLSPLKSKSHPDSQICSIRARSDEMRVCFLFVGKLGRMNVPESGPHFCCSWPYLASIGIAHSCDFVVVHRYSPFESAQPS
jgi:hypothetical protein